MEPVWRRCGNQTLNLRYHRTTSNHHLRCRHRRHLAADSTHANTTAQEAQA